MGVIKLLFLSDTHLGFDLPLKPRVQRRRRGEDFFANTRRALQAATAERVSAVVHGGDLFFRSRVPPSLVDKAFSPFKELADLGTPVFIVPGNHERSCIPCSLLSKHPGIHIFDRAKTCVLERDGIRLALPGFPYWRHSIRSRFPEVLRSTGWQNYQKDSHAVLLCLHHCFEGAIVGPGGRYMFRTGDDVIRHRDIPEGIHAVLSGHIHRHQVLVRDLKSRPLRTPVLYSGSIERTSFVEQDEPKGYMLVRICTSGPNQTPTLSWEFRKLPARPMVQLDIPAEGMGKKPLYELLMHRIQALDPQSVVRLRIQGSLSPECLPLLQAASLRRICPESMNISLRLL
jgi:exonuclease SbcD